MTPVRATAASNILKFKKTLSNEQVKMSAYRLNIKSSIWGGGIHRLILPLIACNK